jgi:spore coat protein U-like protein
MNIRNVKGITMALALSGAAAAAAQLSAAGSATATMSVSASVSNNCTISTTALSFGAYDPIVANDTANLDGTGSVTITCTKGSTPTVGMNTGSNADGSTRRLADSSSNFIAYELFSDSQRSTVWGNSGTALFTPATTPSKDARQYTVYGRIAGGQDVPAGSYSDSITATVNF